MSRPLKGKQARKLVSMRLEPDEKELLKKYFGGTQAAVDYLLGSIKRFEAKRGKK